MTTNELAQNWDRLCDELREFGHEALAFADDIDQSEGIRHALRFLAHLADHEIEYADPTHPEFRRVLTATRKFYGDGVDIDYDSACISPDHTYRVCGTRGTIPYLAFLVNRRSKTDRIAGNLIDADLAIQPDGTFEFWLSKEPQEGPGVLLDDRCNEVVVRQYHHDRAAEIPVTYSIEVVESASPARPQLESDWLSQRLARIARGLEVAPARLRQLIDVLQREPNTCMDITDALGTNAFFGTESNQYRWVYFTLSDDESLEIRLPPVSARHVGVQIFNRWFESLEFRDHVTSLNDRQLTYDADGFATVRVGGPIDATNRLDATGHRQGFLVVRYLECRGNAPIPTCTVVTH